MRAAAIAGAVFAAFIGVMYLRFSGDSVPPSEPAASPRTTGITVRDPAGRPSPKQRPAPDSARHLVAADPSFLPESLREIPTWQLQPAEETALPEGVALIIETGCFQCDGPTTGLIRVYRAPDGSARREQLFSPDELQLPARRIETSKGVEEHAPAITGFAVNDAGTEIVVGVCTKGLCGGLEGGTPEAVTAIFRSVDGGITWAVSGEVNQGAYVHGLLTGGRILLSVVDSGGLSSYLVFPEMVSIMPPRQEASPAFIGGGEIVWNDGWGLGRLVSSDGSPMIMFPEEADLLPTPVVYGSLPNTVALAWSWRHGLSGYAIGLSDTSAGELSGVYLSDETILIGADAGGEKLFGNANVSPEQLTSPPPTNFTHWLPSLIDLSEGTIRPIAEPFMTGDAWRGRNRVVAVQHGPFARVVKTDGDCLNIRADYSLDAQPLTCAAEGVLLRYVGQTTDPSGALWARVASPDGIEGYASTQYLEY